MKRNIILVYAEADRLDDIARAVRAKGFLAYDGYMDYARTSVTVINATKEELEGIEALQGAKILAS